MRIHPLFMEVYNAWKNKKAISSYELIGEDLKDYFRAVNDAPGYPIRYDMQSLPYKQSNTAFYFPEGALFVFSNEPLSTEASQIFQRFAGVFGQTYRRYLDLQKAEANAREARIEAALERVRAKAMAMHSSKDLAETLNVFYRELKSLSVIPIRCGVALMDKNTRMAELTTMNTTEQGDSIEIIGSIKMAGHTVLDGVFESWLKQKEYHAVLRGNQIKEYYQVLKPQISYLDYPHDQVQFGYYFMFNEGDVYAWTEKELTEHELTIYRRFTTVISLTYKRYKDLQQAEAQAREAKIEAGLERVRARTMAMHSSDDVSAATATMFTELEKLGIQNLRGGITIIKPDQTQEVWSVNNLAEGKTVTAIGVFDMRLHPFWREIFKGFEKKDDYHYYWLAGRDKEEYIAILNSTPNYLAQPIKDFPDVHVQSYFFGEGAIWTNSLQPHSEEDKQVMKRFASVFSLTFRRYQDLKKAEAQAREATIEAALEKVRGKAMAMHNSNDLSVTASMVITELRKLGINPIRCGVGILNKHSHKGQLYTATSSAHGDSLSVVGWVLLERHPVLEQIYQKWSVAEDYFPELSGDSMKAYYEQLLAGLSVPLPEFKDEQKHYGHFFSISVGCLYAWSDVKYNDDEIKILKRFATTIDLTFRRYFELQKSEANAREAVKQAALDRVRADIASMRTVSDLDRITPLIWKELTILGVPFIRCGVFIMDETQKLIHTFLSTPEGKAIAAFHLPYDTPGNISKVIDNWQRKKVYVDHWAEEEFIQFADILMKQGTLSSREQYLKTIPEGGFHLHFLPFLQGMLYVGNTERLNEEQIELIQHVADAFSTAYARYEDFNKLEAAKQQVENTLTDLKQAQQQLVQSEKMASLGELTAGIAHEIQNPLNFVNNFSDVSNELLDEMKNELEKGNKEDAVVIIDNVKQNLEKILHHGKRADAIVKGMLQHSRAGSGHKEMTDINVLADEYLRLAYHGLRAKDKSFNAKFETDFDNNIGKINVMPQDIGRVILNLINNAFYAVTEKKKQNSNGYEPTVAVHTKQVNDKIEIKVCDNGNGIPQKLLDKIFQPFFTTKPTGQGTGLGLSLAYDIVTKGHGGELKVKTKEGEGSEFIIQLPTN
jgi:signal transduction histidine kinase